MATKEKESNKIKEMLENSNTEQKNLKQKMSDVVQEKITHKLKLEE